MDENTGHPDLQDSRISTRLGTSGTAAGHWPTMRPYASPRPLAWLSAAVLLSAALLLPVIRDAPGAEPEGGSNSVTEKPAPRSCCLRTRSWWPGSRRSRWRCPRSRWSGCRRRRRSRPPRGRWRRLRTGTADRVPFPLDQRRRPASRARPMISLRRAQPPLVPEPPVSHSASPPRGPVTPRLPSNLPHCPLRAPTLGTILRPPCRHHGK